MEKSYKEVIIKRLHKLIKKEDINKIANDVDIEYRLLLDWYNGKKSPNLINLIKLANYFDVSMDSFLFS